MDLALKYGGFTSLDKVYLQNTLSDLSDNQKLAFITPPPSVINAYFAEIYQKQSPEAATDYYLELSKELNLFNPVPSFDEHKPFIRLNLSGKSYGFCYENADENGISNSNGTNIKEVTKNELLSKEFYTNVLHFDESIWNLDNIQERIYSESPYRHSPDPTKFPTIIDLGGIK